MPINLAVIPLKTSDNDDEKLVFDDEQGAGLFKSLSETDDKFKDSDRTTENYKNSFDSRKTSQKRLQIQDIEESKSPPKNPDMFQIDTKNLQESSSTNISLQNTDRKKQYHDIDGLALFTLKDWKDSIIFDWYSSATRLQRSNFVAHVIQRENEESGNSIDVLNMEELTYVMKLINSRDYFIKKSVNERQNEDGTKVNDYIKFDAFNVVELFESLKRTIVFVYGLFGLDKYILYRVYGIYHQDDDKRFRTTENATKLCIRCKLGYEMISKWTNVIDQITERNLISKSIWNVIYETKSKKIQVSQQEEDRIIKGIEDLINYNDVITKGLDAIANSEFKMLLMVATYRTEEYDDDGNLHILKRKKRGFIYDKNDYFRNPSKTDQYPG